MLVLGNGRHTKHWMHNHFSRICSLCIFYFVQDFCISVDQLFFSLVFIIQNIAIFCRKGFLNFKALKGCVCGSDGVGGVPFVAIRCHEKLLNSLYFTSLSIQITAAHQVKGIDNIAQDENHSWCWWHLYHQESLHGKESMSGRRASLLLDAFSVMCENFMLSMTHTLQRTKNKERTSTQ